MTLREIYEELRLKEDTLLSRCERETYQASSPGGQKRNRVRSAVRLRHRPSGISVTASESRRGESNIKEALEKLRIELCLLLFSSRELMSPPAPPDEREFQVPFRLASPSHFDFALCVFAALLALSDCAGELNGAALKLKTTRSALTRFLKKHKKVQAAVETMRVGFGLGPLKW